MSCLRHGLTELLDHGQQTSSFVEMFGPDCLNTVNFAHILRTSASTCDSAHGDYATLLLQKLLWRARHQTLILTTCRNRRISASRHSALSYRGFAALRQSLSAHYLSEHLSSKSNISLSDRDSPLPASATRTSSPKRPHHGRRRHSHLPCQLSSTSFSSSTHSSNHAPITQITPPAKPHPRLHTSHHANALNTPHSPSPTRISPYPPPNPPPHSRLPPLHDPHHHHPLLHLLPRPLPRHHRPFTPPRLQIPPQLHLALPNPIIPHRRIPLLPRTPGPQ